MAIYGLLVEASDLIEITVWQLQYYAMQSQNASHVLQWANCINLHTQFVQIGQRVVEI